MERASKHRPKTFRTMKRTPQEVIKEKPNRNPRLKLQIRTRTKKIIKTTRGEKRKNRFSYPKQHESCRKASQPKCNSKTASKTEQTKSTATNCYYSVKLCSNFPNDVATEESQQSFCSGKANGISRRGKQQKSKNKNENNNNNNNNKSNKKRRSRKNTYNKSVNVADKYGTIEAEILAYVVPKENNRMQQKIEQQNNKQRMQQTLTDALCRAHTSEINAAIDGGHGDSSHYRSSRKIICNFIHKQEKTSSFFKLPTSLRRIKSIKPIHVKKEITRSGKLSRNSKNTSNSLRYSHTKNILLPMLFMLLNTSVLIRASVTYAGKTLPHVAGMPAEEIPLEALGVSKSLSTSPDTVLHAELNEQISTIILSQENSLSDFNNGDTVTPSTVVGFYDSINARHRIFARDAAKSRDDEDDSSYHDDGFDEYEELIRNKSAKGKYIGAPCNEMKCEPSLLHVTCDKETLKCGCEKNYPVQLGLTKGCDKPKKLGEQCFYDATCMYNDENSLCVQVRHNARCQCASGFHSVSYTKPTRRVFCTQDLKELTSDLPTLLGVTTGIAVLAGLICMVLHLFSKTKYPRHRNFGDANIPPPIMYSSDTGIPLIVQSGRPSSRSSIRSTGSIGSYGNRRSSSVLGGVGGGGGSGSSKGVLVSTSRTGSRRPSLASVHSTSSSVRSYSMMRFEKETQQKEIRQEMKLRLARLQQQQQVSQNRPQIIIGNALTLLGGRLERGGPSGGNGDATTAFGRLSLATPSPLTPNSTDELLPVVDESQEYPLTIDKLPMTSAKPKSPTSIVAVAAITAVQEIATTSTIPLAASSAPTSSSATTKISVIAEIVAEKSDASAAQPSAM